MTPTSPVTPPQQGDIQRRCWTLYMHPDGSGQCVLFNGHGGPHQFSEAASRAVTETPEGLDVAALVKAMAVNNVWAHMGSTNPETHRRIAGNVAAEYARLAHKEEHGG
jgi:hypothetical protein